MDWFDHVIVGSGPSGVAAARRLVGQRTCIVDVGELEQAEFPYQTLQASLAAGDTTALLGERWEMLANLVDPKRLHPKLRSAALRYVLSGEAFKVLDSARHVILCSAGSHAAGGMSNSWGAQLLRYTDADIADAGGWPIKARDLEKYYVDLEQHIGIAGQVDDMWEFLGDSSLFLPPTPSVPAAEHVYARYAASKSRTRDDGLVLGRPRLALATEPFRGDGAFKYGETEFFATGQPGLYTARRTLNELLMGGGISYIPRHKLTSYREEAEEVVLGLVELRSGGQMTLRTRHLMLACGTIQTAQLVLRNHHEFERSLPFSDHPPTLLPLFVPRMFGSELPTSSFPVQLVGTLKSASRRDMISFYYPGALLWSDLLPDVPLPMNNALSVLGDLLGGMLVAQIWETSRPSPHNRLRLDAAGEIIIEYPDRSEFGGLGQFVRALRPLGVYSLKRLASMSPPGWGFHHAGCLPMRTHPGPYETHVDGRLWDSKRVRAIDGSVLPSLPAKNHSLTLMANAARIADEVMHCGY